MVVYQRNIATKGKGRIHRWNKTHRSGEREQKMLNFRRRGNRLSLTRSFHIFYRVIASNYKRKSNFYKYKISTQICLFWNFVEIFFINSVFNFEHNYIYVKRFCKISDKRFSTWGSLTAVLRKVWIRRISLPCEYWLTTHEASKWIEVSSEEVVFVAIITFQQIMKYLMRNFKILEYLHFKLRLILF